MSKKFLSIKTFVLSGMMLLTGMSMNAENPFLSAYNTPFNIPPFDKITDSDYLPAFKEGMPAIIRK